MAGGQAFFATGTDTGGSIRQPASLTGTVGLKPTYGRVSRYGMIAFASSLDQGGPFARSVRDVAPVLQAMAGHDPRDSTSVDVPVPDYAAALSGEVRGMRLGVPREYFVAGMEPRVEEAVRAAISTLEGMGAEIMEVSLPSTDAGLATYYIIAPAEASANLARYDGVKYGLSAGNDDLLENYLQTRGSGFGAEVKRRIMLGTYALSAGYYDAYYVKAQQVRTLIKAEFDRVLADVDALLAPTSPSVAFKIGAKTDDPLLMYLNDACTLPVNIAGLPGISRPVRACRWVAGGPAGDRQGLRRADDPARGRCLRADGRLRRPASADRPRLNGGLHLLRHRGRSARRPRWWPATNDASRSWTSPRWSAGTCSSCRVRTLRHCGRWLPRMLLRSCRAPSASPVRSTRPSSQRA